MRRRDRLRRAGGLGLGLLLFLAAPAPAQDAPGDPAARPVLEPGRPASRLLVLPPEAGRVGRMALPDDAVAAALVAAGDLAPRAGEIVSRPGRADRTWESLAAGADGGFRGRALVGGWAYAVVPSPDDVIAILQAAGHSGVRVNGEPRVGDVYGNGTVRLPIALRKGDNHLLFQGGRGSLRVAVVAPRAAVQVEPADATLPDLVAGEPAEALGAVVVLNCSERALEDGLLRATLAGGEAVEAPIPAIPPLGLRKVPVPLRGPAVAAPGPRALRVEVRRAGDRQPRDVAELTVNTVAPMAARKVTFTSAIDGSVQYYGFVPASVPPAPSPGGRPPGLILSLHGASVEGIGQASVYAPRPWAHVAAPTNRRPYGFDWEDWGRLDAIEVLERVQREQKTDPTRVYLTGHSMGGHGTWHLGVTFPDRFAAVAPSAGWVSMFTYAGMRRQEDASPVGQLLRRPGRPSDTLALVRNLAPLGVYVLHGDADDNVPVDQARTMRAALGEFHADFAYYERPGAGHWWGNECCDWPPLMDFLRARERPDSPGAVREIAFTTANPGVSASYAWATIEAQDVLLEPSTIRLQGDPASRRIRGTTENVARLALDVGHLEPGGPARVSLDGQELTGLPAVAPGLRLWFVRDGERWSHAEPPAPGQKGPHRNGPFKDAFRHRVQLVHGTKGTPEENAWALARARYDAETFYYRGNGAMDVVPDTAFNPAAEPDRNVVLYGNAETNAAWPALLGSSPVQVSRRGVRAGDLAIEGDSLAALQIRPRPGSDRASVGAISGTGLPGARLSEFLPIFVSGVAYPDVLVIGPEGGRAAVRLAALFGNDWGLASGELAVPGMPVDPEAAPPLPPAAPAPGVEPSPAPAPGAPPAAPIAVPGAAPSLAPADPPPAPPAESVPLPAPAEPPALVPAPAPAEPPAIP
jgi:dienelactone hydrolase